MWFTSTTEFRGPQRGIVPHLRERLRDRYFIDDDAEADLTIRRHMNMLRRGDMEHVADGRNPGDRTYKLVDEGGRAFYLMVADRGGDHTLPRVRCLVTYLSPGMAERNRAQQALWRARR